MAGMGKVFGRPAPSSVAQNILNSPIMSQMPSPKEPAAYPGNQTIMAYSRLVAACYEIRKVEQDPVRLIELVRCLEFGERSLQEDAQKSQQEVGTPPPPTPPPMQQGMPPGMTPGMPGAAANGPTMAPPPGAPGPQI